MRFTKTILSMLALAGRRFRATGEARAEFIGFSLRPLRLCGFFPTNHKGAKIAKTVFWGFLLVGLLLTPSGMRPTANSIELEAAGPVGAPLQFPPLGPCSVLPNTGQQGQSVPVIITLGPSTEATQIAQLIALVGAQTVLNATTVTFQPTTGIRALLTSVTAVSLPGPTAQVQVRYTGTLIIASDAAAGLRDMTITVVIGMSRIELACPRAFQVLAPPDLRIDALVGMRRAGETTDWGPGDPRLRPTLWQPGAKFKAEARVAISATVEVTQSFKVSVKLDGKEAASVTVQGVPAGVSKFVSLSWDSTEGAHQLEFMVDSANQISETNETNNTLKVQTVSAFNLPPKKGVFFPNGPQVSLNPGLADPFKVLAGPSSFPALETAVVSANQNVVFQADASSVVLQPKTGPPPAGQVYYPFAYTFDWTFGDGAGATGQIVNHTYAVGQFTGSGIVKLSTDSAATPFKVASTNKPVITALEPLYYHTFLPGPEVENIYTAKVNWNGNTPGSVHFKLKKSNGSTLSGDDTSAPFEFMVNVGGLSHFNNVLTATAAAPSAPGDDPIVSDPYVYNICVVPVPSWLLDQKDKVKVTKQAPTVTYDFGPYQLFKKDGKSDILNKLVAAEYNIESTGNATLKSTGEASGQLKANGFLTANIKDTLAAKAEMNTTGTILLTFNCNGISWTKATLNGQGDHQGCITLNLLELLTLLGINVDTGNSTANKYLQQALGDSTVTLCTGPQMKIDLTFFPSNKNCIPGVLNGIGCSGTIGAGYNTTLDLLLSLVDIAVLKVKAGLNLGFCPAVIFDVSPIEVKDFEVSGKAGVKVGVKLDKIFQWGKQCNITGCFSMAGDGCTVCPGYAGPYGTLVCSNWNFSKDMSSISEPFAYTFYEPPTLLQTGTGERKLVQRVPSDASPTIALASSQALAVWMQEGEESDDLFYSFSRVGLEFTEPKRFTRDAFVDADPDIAFDVQGNAVMVWSRNPTRLTGNEPIDRALSGFEIFYSKFDGQTWSAPRALTNNNVLDTSSVLLKDREGRLAVVWSRNPNNSFLPDRDDPDEIYFARWNGIGFDQPQLVRRNDYAIGRSFAWSDDRLIYVWRQDLDGEPTTSSDRELFYLTRGSDGRVVEGRITNDDKNDLNPQVTFDSNGQPLLVWTRLEKLITEEGQDKGWTHHLLFSRFTGDRWTPPQTVERETQAQGIKLARDSVTGDIVLIWPEVGESGLDLFYRAYDARQGIWSKKVKLTDDKDLENSFSLAVDNRQMLAIYLKDEVRRSEGNVEIGDSSLYVLEAKVAPDLAIEELTVSNTNARAGERVSIVAKVVNKGVLPAENVTLEVKADDRVVGRTMIPIVPPDPEKGVEVAMDWVVPASTSTLGVTATVDPDGRIDELNEANNSRRVFVRAPDLALADVQIAKPPISETETPFVIVKATVENRGATPSAATDLTLFYNQLGAETRRAFATLMVPALQPGERTELEYVWDLTSIPPAEYEIAALVDQQGATVDADRRNNEFLLRTKLLPDLRISAFDIVWEAPGRIAVNVANDGLHSAFNAQLSIVDVTTGSEVASTILSVAPQTQKRISVNVPSSLKTVMVILDPEGKIEELDKSNNIASRNF